MICVDDHHSPSKLEPRHKCGIQTVLAQMMRQATAHGTKGNSTSSVTEGRVSEKKALFVHTGAQWLRFRISDLSCQKLLPSFFTFSQFGFSMTGLTASFSPLYCAPNLVHG